MKKIDFLLCALFFAMIIAAKPSDAYEKAMKSAIEQVFQAETLEQYQAASNTFDRIAEKETKAWHPRYYSAYAHIIMSTLVQESTAKDEMLDQAMERLLAADELSPGNSELLTLEGFVHMMRVVIDPGSRGAEYSGRSIGAFQKAVAMDSNNPRALMLLSNMQIGTAQFFGSDNSEGCATLAKAIQLFENAGTPENPLDPSWGKDMALGNQQASCN